MSAFIFTGSLDAKGRLTVPARIRSRFGLEQGARVTVLIEPSSVDRYQVDSFEKAQQLLAQYDSVASFSYQDGVLEVVCDD